MDKLVCIPDFEKEALRILDRNTLDFYKSGADEEVTLAENKNAFKRWAIRPRMLRDISNRDLSTTVLGKKVSFPVGISPTAQQKLAHDDGELGTSRAAAAMDTIFILSTVSNTSLEEVAKGSPGSRKWFQLYAFKDRNRSVDLIRRAEVSGYEALVITVDRPYMGKRRKNARRKFCMPKHLRLANFDEEIGMYTGVSKQNGGYCGNGISQSKQNGGYVDTVVSHSKHNGEYVDTVVSHSKQNGGYCRNGVSQSTLNGGYCGNDISQSEQNGGYVEKVVPHSKQDGGYCGNSVTQSKQNDEIGDKKLENLQNMRNGFETSLTWKDIDWFRNITTLPIIVKGIMTAEDADLAVVHGVDGVFVSNHGGRQLDTVHATIDVLEEVVTAVNGRCDVYLDGGVSTGTDVFKALALGANMVFAGRPFLWGLAVGGENGAKRVLEIFKEELDLTMALAGACSVGKIIRNYVEKK